MFKDSSKNSVLINKGLVTYFRSVHTINQRVFYTSDNKAYYVYLEVFQNGYQKQSDRTLYLYTNDQCFEDVNYIDLPIDETAIKNLTQNDSILWH